MAMPARSRRVGEGVGRRVLSGTRFSREIDGSRLAADGSCWEVKRSFGVMGEFA